MGSIYSIYNNISNKRYIGQTIQPLNKRISQHFNQSKKGINTPLYRSMRMYEKDSFIVTLLEECDINLLDSREQYWINHFNTFKEGYNCDKGGGGIRGHKMSEETRKKMSESKKGKPSNRKGKTNSPESNLKRSQSLKESYKNGTRKPRDYSDVRGKNSSTYKHGKYLGQYQKYRKNKN